MISSAGRPLHVIGILIMILGTIGGFILGWAIPLEIDYIEYYNWSIFLPSAIGSVLSGTLFNGLAEVILLLEDIRSYSRK